MDIHRLLLYIIFGCAATFSQVAPVGQKPKCHEFTGTVPMTSATICDSTEKTLGNGYNPVILDFSQSKKEAFELLTKGFNKISGAFIMDGNEQVDTVNFASIIYFDGFNLGKDSLFISIRNNPNLEKLTWDKNVNQLQIGSLGKDLYIYIYNNPQLDVKSLEIIKKALEHTSIKHALQSQPNECRFQHPINSGSFETPPVDVLKHCKNIEGDMKMDGGSLAGLSLTLGDGACLRLIGVDMTGTSISLRNGTLSPICKDNVTKSEIKNNKGLCGDDLVKLEAAFSDPTVIIKADVSCATTCTTTAQIGNKFVVCQTIDMADADITAWFTDPRLAEKAGSLEAASHRLTISNRYTRAISLPLLREAKDLNITQNRFLDRIDLPRLEKIGHLMITDNHLLSDISMPKLASIEELTILGNQPLLTLDKIKGLPFPRRSTKVVCVTHWDIVISRFEDLRLCTNITGILRLKNIGEKSNPSHFRVKKVDGCLRVENNDNLWDLDFLNETDFSGCDDQHVFKKNRHICPRWYSWNSKPLQITGWDVYGCDKRCWDLKDGQCTTFYGDLTITDKFDPKLVQRLEVIRGRLIIKDTSLKKIELPRLNLIYGRNAPFLVVKNNSKLESVRFPIFMKYVTRGRATDPLVTLEDNPRLRKMIDFLPIPLLRTCGQQKKPGGCYYDEKVYRRPRTSTWSSLDIGNVVVAVVMTVTMTAFIVFFCYKNYVSNKSHRE